ncbi:hypothetical protein MVES1_002922 [Malassezia vespertilionis]|nr:uncharacterized protein MVES1_002922 [Malassezia vespertilionis]WFD07555.1 hypothetical protein MVES1_002922 [Malassezia vespertilionis]
MSKTDGLPNTASLDTKPSNQALPPTKSETPTLAPAASRAVPMTLDTKGKSIASQHMQRPTKQRAVDSKANLRVMLQEKKQGNQRDKKGDSSSGLADFLSQL